MKWLCTVCARGGSKGVPDKNIRPLCGRPMIAWTILQATASGLFERIVVSSDSPAIRAAGLAAGADAAIERPAELATDTAGKVPAIRHAIIAAEKMYGGPYDFVIDLDATAPLRLPQDITGVARLIETSGATNVITATPARHSPYFNLVERGADGTVKLSKPADQRTVRRQDALPCYDMNASIYAWKRDAFIADPRVFYRDTALYEMPAERSCDIDSELDFLIVEFLFERLRIADHLIVGQGA
jgi:N-acylneuraminate cytidylyltransferase/CMP-N,N'-diacetyllegionaminic acid synthase